MCPIKYHLKILWHMVHNVIIHVSTFLCCIFENKYVLTSQSKKQMVNFTTVFSLFRFSFSYFWLIFRHWINIFGRKCFEIDCWDTYILLTHVKAGSFLLFQILWCIFYCINKTPWTHLCWNIFKEFMPKVFLCFIIHKINVKQLFFWEPTGVIN